MAFFPLALTTPQYDDGNSVLYSGAVLKAYAAGTSTPITMATDSTGSTLVGSIALNAEGYPEVSGNVVIPHLDRGFKLSLFPTQAAADSNTGAIWTVDGLAPSQNLSPLSSVAGTNTVTAEATPTIGAYVVDDVFTITPSATNTGAVTLNIDSQGAGAVQLNGAALTGGELRAGVPAQLIVTAATPVFEIVASGAFMPTSGGTFVGVVTHDANVNHTASVKWFKGADIASVAALPVNVAGNYFDVTGTTGITSIDAKGVGTVLRLHFDDALVLSHDANDLILPGVADITTAAGDEAEFVEYASGDWRMTSYQEAALPPTRFRRAAPITTTSGTDHTFTGIPSWVKRITIACDQVSLSGSDSLLIQIGDAGGIETTGYDSAGSSGATNVSSTTGFVVQLEAAAIEFTGKIELVNITGNTWVSSHTGSRGSVPTGAYGGGRKVLSETLDRVNVTRTGTDTFDNGQVNIFYE